MKSHLSSMKRIHERLDSLVLGNSQLDYNFYFESNKIGATVGYRFNIMISENIINSLVDTRTLPESPQ
jgi:hypothetical protein